MSKHVLQYAGAGLAAVVVALVAFALGTSHDTSSASAQRAGFQGPPAAQQGATNGQGAPDGQAPPGFGTPVTGASAQKAAAAATAKHPGQVERVMQLSDGSYVVHVIASGGELHVAVSKSFAVTGVQQGGPGGPGGPGVAPQTQAPASDTVTS